MGMIKASEKEIMEHEIIRLQNIGISLANENEQQRKEIERLKDQLAGSIPEDIKKYLQECFNEMNGIYGAVVKVAIYGGSAFAIYEGGECYRVNFQSYKSQITLDTPLKN